MANVLLHVGAHKTATTYIQLSLDALNGRLAADGVIYPTVWRAAGSPGQAGLVELLRQGQFALVSQQLHAMLREPHRLVVISAEDLETLDDTAIAGLRDGLGDVSVQVVYYVRRWPESLRSNWQESVKHGAALTLPEFFTGQMLHFPQSRVLNFGAGLQGYAQMFGAETIRIASYSHLVDSGIDVVRHFFATFLGIEDAPPPIDGRPNASLDLLDTEVIRVLNSIDRQSGRLPSDRLRNWYLERGRPLVPPSLLSAMGQNVVAVDIDETRPPFGELHRGLCAQYAASIVPPVPPQGLFEPRQTRLRYVRPDYLTGMLIRDILQHMHQEFERATGR